MDSYTNDNVNYTPAIESETSKCLGGNGVQTEIGCVPKDPWGFASAYYAYGLGLIGGLSVLFIIFGGYLMLTSEGNPNRLNNGKTFIFYALFGLVLAIFGFVFVEVIAVDILKIPGFSN
jgi:hypothetical protein